MREMSFQRHKIKTFPEGGMPPDLPSWTRFKAHTCTPPGKSCKSTPPGKSCKSTPPGKSCKSTPPSKSCKSTPPGKSCTEYPTW